MNNVEPLLFHDLQHQFAKTREPLADARHLPGQVYSSPEIAAQEKDRIFMKEWLCVAHVDELPNPGDYLTKEIVGEPFVVTRNAEGQIVAFMNMCLHRGVAVAYGTGNAKDFSCPYHAWLYDLDGKLVTAPRLENDSAPLGNSRLHRLHSVVWRGWIFVTFNPNPIPFEEHIGVLGDELWWFQTDQCALADKMVLEIDCNWKLLVENLVDIYHVPVIHKGTIGAFNNYRNLQARLYERGSWAYDQKGRPHSKTGEQLFPTLPWLEGNGAENATRAGLFPNINMSMRYDSLRLWQAWPRGVDKMTLECYFLFDPKALKMEDFHDRLDHYRTFVRQIIKEDAEMVVALQKAMSSRFYEPGPMAKTEIVVQHLMKYYLEAMGM
ncbi:aromatic ring-hydroxylating dioxygenase subunit alpha [uncultured Pigmentiphaga sp.]|uniref:aromatic ring-hydroxylating oxygenase subunit alpha n=1 Tax=uncultured Pigmentiphaga sp. TaxID=340361 RepID=UPI002621F083|nr:aromatic ring-hydroxylating dioxygenase subunit alpha [uncultured Pigmentiphaga sp.]